MILNEGGRRFNLLGFRVWTGRNFLENASKDMNTQIPHSCRLGNVRWRYHRVNNISLQDYKNLLLFLLLHCKKCSCFDHTTSPQELKMHLMTPYPIEMCIFSWVETGQTGFLNELILAHFSKFNAGVMAFEQRDHYYYFCFYFYFYFLNCIGSSNVIMHMLMKEEVLLNPYLCVVLGILNLSCGHWSIWLPFWMHLWFQCD